MNNKNHISAEKACILEARNITRCYRSGKHQVSVLKGIDLKIYEGDFMTISGASGVGKSTLLHILGLLDAPSSGELLFRGTDTSRLSRSKQSDLRNRSIGFIFQFFYLLPEFDALENVMLPALMRRDGVSKKEKKDRAAHLLEQVGLGHRLTHRPAELSGGEQQRVGIARAIMNNPEIIFADEPTGNLDSAASIEIHDLLRHLNTERGHSVVIVTHNPDLANVGRKKMHMIDGYIQERE